VSKEDNDCQQASFDPLIVAHTGHSSLATEKTIVKTENKRWNSGNFHRWKKILPELVL